MVNKDFSIHGKITVDYKSVFHYVYVKVEADKGTRFLIPFRSISYIVWDEVDS